MKIRIGFVSNSSSSSFVVIGFKIPDDDKRLQTNFYDDLTEKTDLTYHGEERILGFELATERDYSLEVSETSIPEINEMHAKLIKICEENNIIVPEIKMLTGTRVS